MGFESIEHLLACPACSGVVERSAAEYRCIECNREFPIRYGIPDFRLQPDPYISVEAEIGKIEGFRAPGRSFADMVRAYYVLTPESPPSLHQRYMASMDAAVVRGAGLISKLRSRFPDSGTATMLDLGCGTGGMSISAVRTYERVVGVDVALRWLVMGKQRLHEAGIDVPLICANAESLPFRSEAFDAVLADSVVEHVRDSTKMRDEALRVLVPSGAWFFVTNNRFSVLPEPHVRLWGFGLLPRGVMERVAWKVRATPYKVKLHSREELRRIFDDYGEVMLPYYEAGELGPRNEGIRKTWETLSSVDLIRRVAGAVVPQYFIAGRKGNIERHKM
jgi:ubiquinone/menaquinone biosynthesis C-methylase UbiE/uncharacterized protein YbaR (Trm112 family)